MILRECVYLGMIHIETKQAIQDLRRQYAQLGEQQVNRAISLAFNRTMSRSRTQLARAIRRRYPASALKQGGYSGGKGLIIDRANRRKLYAELRVSHKRVPLIYFKSKEVPGGVQVEVTKGERHVLPFAFIAKGQLKRKQVLARGRYRRGRGFVVRRKRVDNRPHDLPITKLVGVKVNKPAPEDLLHVRDFARNSVSKELSSFFDKIHGKALK